MPDILDRLRDRDPAATTDAAPPDDLLRRIVAEPRPAPAPAAPAPRRRRPVRRRAALAGAGLATAVAALAGISAIGDGGPSPDLAARAYAQTDPGAQILHVVTETRQEFLGAGLPGDETTRFEKWTHGDEAHTIISSDGGPGGTPESYDQLLGPDGVINNKISTGETQTLSEDEGPEQRQIVADGRADFVTQFRSRYERGQLDPGGTTTFDGRAAQRYVVRGPASTDRIEYYVDAETGEPLGSVRVAAIYAPKLTKGGGLTEGRLEGRIRTTETVETLERLPVDAESLARLRTRE
jgi:hypothetical protein